MERITLTRASETATAVFGVLSHCGEAFGLTLEGPRGQVGQIPSCVPAGVYIVPGQNHKIHGFIFSIPAIIDRPGEVLMRPPAWDECADLVIDGSILIGDSFGKITGKGWGLIDDRRAYAEFILRLKDNPAFQLEIFDPKGA